MPLNTFEMMARCVASAPLGLPVVPEVYMMVASSSGPTSASGAAMSGRLAQDFAGPISFSSETMAGAASSSPPRATMMVFSCGSFGRWSRMRSSFSGSTMATFAPESARPYSSSSPVHQELSGVATAPMSSGAKNATGHCG